MDIKEFVKKNLITILSVVAILAMFLNFVTFKTETSYNDSIQKFNGFQLCSRSSFSYFFILGPALLIVMNYIKQLEKYKGILSMVIPAIGFVDIFIVFFAVKSALTAGGDALSSISGAAGIEMDTSYSMGIGMILSMLSYLGMVVYGVITQKNFSVENLGDIDLSIAKPDIEKIKSAGAELMKSAQSGVAKAAQSISESIPTASSTHTSKKQVDDTLSLIERLAKMKDDGILTEEEFAEKKKKLLEEI